MCTHPVEASETGSLDERIVEATIGTLEMFGLYLGSRLGLYQSLRSGPMTVSELAQAAGIDQRYAREWLEQQAVAGFLLADEVVDPQSRRYELPEEHAGVLADETDGAHVAPLSRMVVGIANVLDQVVDAYRTGDGVPYEDYGADFRHGQGKINRPAFENDLVDAWLPAVPGVAEKLEAGATVADIGCGQGYSTVAVARRWPTAGVLGVDSDPASIADARAHAEESGSPARFAAVDAESLADLGRFDVVLVLEALHDMARPVDALVAARKALAEDGVLVIADEKVAESFTAPGDDLERMMYGWSITHCLPASRTEHDSAALGTALRIDTVRELALTAGFSSIEEVDVDGGFFRIYEARV